GAATLSPGADRLPTGVSAPAHHAGSRAPAARTAARTALRRAAETPGPCPRAVRRDNLCPGSSMSDRAWLPPLVFRLHRHCSCRGEPEIRTRACVVCSFRGNEKTMSETKLSFLPLPLRPSAPTVSAALFAALLGRLLASSDEDVTQSALPPPGGEEPAIDPVARGEYLVDHVSACPDCHTPRNMMGAPVAELYLSGAE